MKPDSAFFYRCGACNLNLLYVDEYRRCPRCETPTATRPHGGVEVLSHEQVRQLKFEWYLEDETPQEREQRRIAAEVDERVRLERLSHFSEVIEGAGFSEWERQRHDELEAKFKLPAEQRHLGDL